MVFNVYILWYKHLGCWETFENRDKNAFPKFHDIQSVYIDVYKQENRFIFLK